jgi:hypothetical protein
MNRILLLTAWLLAGLPLTAQDTPSDKLVTCEVRWIELLRPEANKIFNSTDYVVSADQLRQLNDLVAQKKAVILAQPRVTTSGGLQAQARNVTEFIYPTEYGLLENASQDGAATVTQSNLTIHLTVNNAANPAPPPPRQEPVVVPSGFRTREVGNIFNVTPTVAHDNNWISCTMVPELSVFGGFYEYVDPTQKQPVKIQQPKFYTYNVQTTVLVKSGQTVLLTIHDGKHYQDADKVILVLFSAAITSK